MCTLRPGESSKACQFWKRRVPEEFTYVCWGGRGAPGVAAPGEIIYEGPQQGAGSIPSDGLLRSSSLNAQLKSPPTTTGIVQCSRGVSLVKRETLSATLVGPYTLITLIALFHQIRLWFLNRFRSGILGTLVLSSEPGRVSTSFFA